MSEVVVDHRLIAGDEPIPTLLIRPRDAGPLPAVVLLHGLGYQKEGWVERARPIAAQGVVVVIPDARKHGERRDPQVDWEAERLPMLTTYRVVRDTAADVRAIGDYLLQRPDLCNGRIGLRGFSMGGYVALAAAAHDRRLDPVLCIAGGVLQAPASVVGAKPSLTFGGETCVVSAEDYAAGVAVSAELDIRRQSEAFRGRNVMFVHGEHDGGPPFTTQWQLYQALSPHFADTPERLCFLSYPGGHHPPAIIERLSWRWLIDVLCDTEELDILT